MIRSGLLGVQAGGSLSSSSLGAQQSCRSWATCRSGTSNHSQMVSASAGSAHYSSQQGQQSGSAPLSALMADVAAGRVHPEEAAKQLASIATMPAPTPTGDFASTDLTRSERTGFPEVVWGPGKTPLQIVTIMHRLIEREQQALATRIDPVVAKEVQAMLPSEVEYIEQARMLVLRPGSGQRPPRLAGTIAVLTAGTGDAFVAEEARRTAELMGCYTFRLQDLGIDSGLDRVIANMPAIRAADVVIVVAGMDGSLPSVIAGLVDAPVVAVPTSVGYGAALNGISPLLSALTAGAPGVATVNIDNGFGAGMLAARILHTAGKIADKKSQQQFSTAAVPDGVPPHSSGNGNMLSQMG